jgi:5-methylcytosine-specific restriction protein A
VWRPLRADGPSRQALRALPVTHPLIERRAPYRLFRGWLVDQRHRNDGVGDLARDCLADRTRPSFRSLAEWVDYIGGRGSLPYDSLVRGWREFARVSVESVRVRADRRRRHLVLSAPTKARSISVGRRTRILARDGFRCRRCGNGPKDERLLIDHVVPVSRGGSNDDSNLQTLCEPCNQGKADHPPHPHDLEGLR